MPNSYKPTARSSNGPTCGAPSMPPIMSVARRFPDCEDFLENLTTHRHQRRLDRKTRGTMRYPGQTRRRHRMFTRQALRLNPSPEQRIRIRLAISQELLAQNNPTRAIDNDQALLAESPDYPGKAGISGQIAALEQKLAPAK